MRKKIILFSVSMAVAAGGFGAICALTGLSPFTWNANVKNTQHLTTMPGGDSLDLSYEQRKDNGDLEYLLYAPRATPDHDHKGVLFLERPQATFYMSDGQIMVVTADAGTVKVDVGGGMSSGGGGGPGKAFLRGGSLSKNVVLTVGPKASFASGLHELQPGQVRATFDEDITFNNTDHSLVSKGPIHVRSDSVWFDGANLTATFNSDEKRADYVRIDPMAEGGKIIIKQEPGANWNNQTAASGPSSSEDTHGASGPAAAASQVAAAPGVAATNPASAPASSKATVYKADFQDNVKIHMGGLSVASDQLSAIFQFGAGEVIAHPPRTAAPPVVPSAAPGTPFAGSSAALPVMVGLADLSGGSEVAPGAVAPSTLPTIVSPLNVKDSDVVLTWTGPLEVRPLQGASPLLNRKDQVFVASAQGDHAVVVKDGAIRTVRAGKASLQRANQHVMLEAGNLPDVQVSDATMGDLVCQGVDMVRSADALTIHAGAGRAHAFSNPMNGLGGADAGKGQDKPKSPVTIQWGKTLDVTLLPHPDLANPKKENYVLRHAVLVGDAQVSDPTNLLRGQLIDLLLTTTANTKQSLEHLMASGSVHIEGLKPAVAPAQAESYIIESQRLDVQPPVATEQNRGQAGTLLAFADGDVRGALVQQDKNDPSKLIRGRIATPKLLATMQTKPQSGASADSLGSFSITEAQATQGVQIELEGYGPQLVIAVADSLLADPKSGKAHLFGPAADLDPAHFPRVQQGENQITGQTIVLDQKTQSMDIPGAGQFVFQQNAPKAGEAASPVNVTWANHMTYNGKTQLVSLTGPVKAMLLGKPEQTSWLTSHNMQVQLATEKAGGANSGKTRLSQVTAEGDVHAEGASFDGAGKMLTRLHIQGPKLIYDEASKTMLIPAAGQLEAEDYRPEAGKPAKADNSPLAMAGGSKGQTAFGWQDSLSYNGSTGEIHLRKDVHMVHLPNTPAVPARNGEPVRTGRVDLKCDDLVATLATSKTPAANPIALGMGGESKVTKVTAQGAAQVNSDNDILLADTLIYDALTHKAIAIGKDGNAATGLRVDGPGFGSADRIEWDLDKGESGIILIHPRAVMSTPDSK